MMVPANADEWITQTTSGATLEAQTPIGQTFTTPNSARPIVTNISILNIGLSSNVQMCIYTNPTASSLVACSDTKTISAGWMVFNFSPSYYYPSTSYYFEVDSASAGVAINLNYATSDEYSGGDMYSNRAVFSGNDLTFKMNGTNGTNVGNWTLNQGTGSFANDSSGFNNNGTITGALWESDNVNGMSLLLDGTNDQVSIPTNSSLNITDAITISMWIKKNTTASTAEYIIRKGAGNYGILFPASSLTPTIVLNSASRISFNPVNLDTWTHLLFTYDGATLKAYQNGVLDSTSTLSLIIDQSATSLFIGSGGGNFYFNGTIDEVKLYNYALNTTEIATVYQEFQPVPSYPTGAMVIQATYPPQTTNINFSWHDTEYPGDRLEVATDSNFNIKVVDITTTNDYYLATLNSGDTYFWRVRQYNSTTATFGDTSQTENFTITSASSATGNGVQGVVYELINGLSVPVDQAQVHIYNNTYSNFMVTGSNGYYLFDGLANDTYFVYALKQDYDQTAAFPVEVNGSLATKDLLMKKYISPYVPNFVYEKFIVRGLFDNSFPGVSVTVYEGDSLTASFTGITDTMGQVVFRLIKDQRYRVVFSGGGIGSDITIYVFAKEESYLVRVLTGFPTGGDLYNDITTNLTVTTVNATFSNLSLIYNDTRSSTSQIWLYANNLTTGATCYQSSTGQTAYLNCTVRAYGSYRFGFNASSSIYGNFSQDKVINFNAGNTANPTIPLQGTNTTLLQWGSVVLIVFVAALFSVKSVKYGAVVVPFMALFLWAAGWFMPIQGNTVGSFLLLSCAAVLGVLIYLRKSEMKAAIS